jgi:hypothetical protein
MVMLPGALKNIYGYKNDTFKADISPASRKNFGSANIEFTYPSAIDTSKGKEIKVSVNYIFQLLNKDGKILFEKDITGKSSIYFPYLPTGNYSMRIIEDANKNGRWDPGDYAHHIQPEKVFIYPDDLKIKANWELDHVRFDVK